jgi:hypothetical protein
MGVELKICEDAAAVNDVMANDRIMEAHYKLLIE